MRVRTLLMVVALASLGAASSAAAHMGEEDPPTGTLALAPGGSASVALQSVHPQDGLEWVWSSPGFDPAAVGSKVVWTDTAGAVHESAAPLGQRFGTFPAPADFARGELVFTNGGLSGVELTWTYQSSADFWSRPEMVLPATLPFVALGGAIVAGKVLDAHFKRRRSRATASRAPRAEAAQVPPTLLGGGNGHAKPVQVVAVQRKEKSP